jgi:hypothetical protein
VLYSEQNQSRRCVPIANDTTEIRAKRLCGVVRWPDRLD